MSARERAHECKHIAKHKYVSSIRRRHNKSKYARMGQSIRCGYSGGGCCNNSHAMEIWKRIPAIIMLVAIAYISNTNSYGANICGVHCSYRSQLIARTMTRRECAPPNQNERKKKWKIETSNKNARTKCNARYTKRSLRDFSLAMRLTWNRFFFSILFYYHSHGAPDNRRCQAE